jgi:hypothetical protein
MRHWLVVLAVGLAAGIAPAQDDGFVIADPSAPQAIDYLVIAGDDFVPALAPLLAHRRAQGLRPGVVAMTTLRAKFADVRAGLRHALASWDPKPRFLLLVGDVEAVPAEVGTAEFTIPPGEADLATDWGYACPRTVDQPELHVGRFPCDSAAECAVLVQKTLAYEAARAPGAWQHHVAFVTGEAGFSPQLDRMIEQLFINIVAPGIPGGYAVELAYANPRSPFCPDPTRFHAHSLGLLNRGSLFFVYVGHGYRNGVDRLRVNGAVHRVLDTPDAAALDAADGPSVMVVIACSTGQYDHPGDCVGEAFFKRPRGPVAFLGGSRVTQPYFNGLFGKALVDHVFGAATLGEALTAAKQQVLAHAPSPLTQQADFMAGMMQGGPEALPKMRRDGVRHYNLLGDPALRLRRPAEDLTVALAGDGVTITAPRDVAPATVRLTLEVDRGRFARALPAVDATASDAGAQLAARYAAANDPVLRAWELPLVDGVASQAIERPAQPGIYWLKARAPGHVGACRFEVKPPPPKDDDF